MPQTIISIFGIVSFVISYYYVLRCRLLRLHVTAYYRLRQTDYDGQTAISNVLSLDCERAPVGEVKLYPNPTTGEVQIQGYGQAARLRIYNTTGQLVNTIMPADDEDALYIGFLPKGVYLFEFSSEKMTEFHRVVLK